MWIQGLAPLIKGAKRTRQFPGKFPRFGGGVAEGVRTWYGHGNGTTAGRLQQRLEQPERAKVGKLAKRFSAMDGPGFPPGNGEKRSSPHLLFLAGSLALLLGRGLGEQLPHR
jgi:hypothetical protein